MSTTYIENDGGKLAVTVEGTGPLVVCSPGISDLRDAYVPLSAKLAAAGYRVASIDLRGHGDSSVKFNRYGDDATADDYLAVIKALGGGPAVLIGSSMSAAAAVIANGKVPGQIRGLVLPGPFLRGGGNKVVSTLFNFALWKPWGPPFWRFYAKTLWPGLGDKSNARVDQIMAAMARPGRWAAFQDSIGSLNHDVAMKPWLGSPIQTPALVVIGDKDPDWSEPLEEAKWVASNFVKSEIITVPGAGHAPQFENPDIVVPAVLKFLKEIKF